MKPPKTIRSIVSTLLGAKKRSKSEPRSPKSPHEPFESNTIQKSGRNHSVDDLVGGSSSKANRLPHVSSSGSRSLPRRSQSCMNVERPSISRRSNVYGPKIVGNTSEEDEFESERIQRRAFDSRSERTSSGCESLRSNFAARTSQIPRSTSLHSMSRNDRPRRTQSHTFPEITEWDEGFEDPFPRTTSWSHPGHDQPHPIETLQEMSQDQLYRDEERLRRRESKISQTSTRTMESLGRRHSFASTGQENPRLLSSTSSRNTSNTDRTYRANSRNSSGNDAEEKLKNCLNTLNQLSAHMEEIKKVSRRVKNVKDGARKGELHPEEKERQLRELGKPLNRLKTMLKMTAENPNQRRLNSQTSSSGYSSSSTSRRSSSSMPDENERMSRPPSRKSHNQDPNLYYSEGSNHYHSSHPYPHSVSDMMPIWDAKEAALQSRQPPGRLMTKEDSSGYATGSGSEDGRHDSPVNISDRAVMPVSHGRHHHEMKHQYFQQNNNPFHPQQHWHGANLYNQSLEGYDPYGFYPSYHPAMSVDSTMGSVAENPYGTYGELYGYASSSLLDNEVYSDGWYRLPVSNQAVTPQYATNIDHPDSIYQHPGSLMHQDWMSEPFSNQQGGTKYGGLSDSFYDPSLKPTPSVMENVTEEMERESRMSEEPTWKSYGSFRYHNGQRTVVPTGIGCRKRKTVRFSHTVRQRIETEESEVEDSTSVIKGGCDEEEDSRGAATSSANQEEVYSTPSDIYMWPRQDHAKIQQSAEPPTSSCPQGLPEPIYEFPTGHIESSCMCGDCILARGSCQMQPAPVSAYY